MNSKDPCYRCAERLVDGDYNCHSHCDRYAAYRMQIESRPKYGEIFVDRTVSHKKSWRDPNVKR